MPLSRKERSYWRNHGRYMKGILTPQRKQGISPSMDYELGILRSDGLEALTLHFAKIGSRNRQWLAQQTRQGKATYDNGRPLLDDEKRALLKTLGEEER